MPKIRLEPTPRQHQAWLHLTNNITNETLYGGGAGGGKTHLGCAWLIIHGQILPGTRWLIGRKELKRLKQSVLISMFDLLSKWQFKPGLDYIYNAQMGSIKFSNNTEFVLMDLAPMPSDPNYDRLGSVEFTGGFIEEAAEVEQRAKEVAYSRIRYKLSEFCGLCFKPGLNKGKIVNKDTTGQPIEWECAHCHRNSKGLIPKLLLTCNPHKGYLYQEFYKPWKSGTLTPDKAFIRSLVTDNPHISPAYIESLKKLKDKVLRARLLLGDWEYSDDDLALFIYDAILDMFTNTPIKDDRQYITCDVARFGRDKAVVARWEGLNLAELTWWDKSSMPHLETEILLLANRHRIPMSRVLVDEDGIGGGIVDHLKCKGFVGNSAAIESKTDRELREVEYKVNYQNLRSQCYYELSYAVNSRLITVNCGNEVQKTIIEELEQIKAVDVDKDTKLRVIPKDDIKAAIGRSPDFADTLMMRMYFEVKPERRESRTYSTNTLN